jgi:hypothetical protein
MHRDQVNLSGRVITRKEALGKRDGERQDWKAPRDPEGCCGAQPAALPAPDLAGPPPKRARAKPGKRGK